MVRSINGTVAASTSGGQRRPPTRSTPFLALAVLLVLVSAAPALAFLRPTPLRSSSCVSSLSSCRIRLLPASLVAASPLSINRPWQQSMGPLAARRQWSSKEAADGKAVGPLQRAGRAAKVALLPVLAAAASALLPGAKAAHAYRDLRMSPETRVVAAILGRFIIPLALCLYFAVNRKRMAREEARRVREALDSEQKKKEAYIAEMKEQGYNLGAVGGSLGKEEEEMLCRVEAGEQLPASEKAAWVKLLQYSRDVVDGKVNPNPDTPIMTKRELKRVVAANKAVKEKGFRAD